MSLEVVSELYPLLEALCENRQTPAGKERLEQLVIAQPAARRLYIDYMHLHGTLTWDASLSESASLVAYAERTGTPPVRPSRWTKQRLALIIGLLSSALLVVFLVSPGTGPGPNNTVTVVPAPAGSTLPVVVPNVNNHPNPSIAEVTPIPPVHLHRGTTPTSPEIVTPLPTVPTAVATHAPIVDAELVARINRLWQAKLDEAGVQPSPVADDAEWLRRVYLDLAGHIPDAESVDRFLTDSRPDKRGLLIDELVRKPDYVRNLTTIWTNLLVGRTSDRPINRDLLSKFLRDQFRQNRPWTETVARLVSAEGDGNEVGEANFLLAHLNNEAVPATAVTARLFLCQQVQCTQCHKHPDSKHGGSMAEFWELNSFFQQAGIVETRKYNPATGRTEVISRSLVDRAVGGPTYYDDLKGLMRVAYPKFEGQEVDPDPTVKRRQELAKLLTSQGERELAAALVNRTWAHFFGQGLVNPIDDMGPHSPCANPELLDTLTDAVVATNFDTERLNRWIVSTQAYHLSSAQVPGNRADHPVDGELPLFSRMYLKPLSAEQMFDSLLVATAADRAGAAYWEQAEEHRKAWLAQFYSVMENEENGDASTFDGTFSQSLMMMNGDLVQKAISNSPGTVLHEILRMQGDDQERIKSLCRAALGRDPKRNELSSFQQTLRHTRPDPHTKDAEPYGDILWAYLNSTEFAVNH
jgi:Protein of unknown function (DUF1553)/Protein of unknown function (DUF1549)